MTPKPFRTLTIRHDSTVPSIRFARGEYPNFVHHYPDIRVDHISKHSLSRLDRMTYKADLVTCMTFNWGMIVTCSFEPNEGRQS